MDRAEWVEGAPVGRGVVPGRRVLVEHGRAAVMILPPRLQAAAAEACAPQVEVVREGEVIRAIDVTCACGHKIRLRCLPDGAVAGG